MNHINVLLFSKFSDACKNFVSVLKNAPSLMSTITFVCIDNKVVREKVTKEGDLRVTQVPCLLRIFEDTGYIEVFEGMKAFSVVESYISEMRKEIPEQSKLTVTEKSNITFPKENRGTSKQQVTAIDELGDDDGKVAVSTYLHIPRDDNGQDDVSPMRTAPQQTVGGATNLVSKALQMQKERDEETKNLKMK